MSYRQLNELANRFASMLRTLRVEPGARVGVHLPRSGRAIAAMVGAMRAGAVYVPLDPGSPPARLKLIANDCGIRHVFLSPALYAQWIASPAADPVEVFLLSDDAPQATARPNARLVTWAALCASSDTPLDPLSDSPDELAYLLYTSGSTGVPKGVMLSHRNALAFVDWAADLIALGPSDRVASVAPFHFDLSVFDVWASLSRGATIVIVDEATVVSGSRMVERVREREISVWYSVPTAIMLMMDTGKLAGAPSLRAVYFAGEVFPVQQLRRTMQALPQVRFYNLFGPTETNVCTGYEVPGPPPPEATSIPIGTPSCGDVATILGPDGAPVPDGEIGELFIDGPTVMLGYWDAGRRTPAKRPYPTGDMVARRADGELLYHGRRDHMVKIHGFRVELGEVEVALTAHPMIAEAIVVVHDKELVALVVPADPTLSVLEVKRHCAGRLPKYMVPHGVWLVGALPRTSSGKTDRVRSAAAVRDGDRSALAPTLTNDGNAERIRS